MTLAKTRAVLFSENTSRQERTGTTVLTKILVCFSLLSIRTQEDSTPPCHYLKGGDKDEYRINIQALLQVQDAYLSNSG
jgi:hypothetical protein